MTGVVDTWDKFMTGVADTGDKFMIGVADTGNKFMTGVNDFGHRSLDTKNSRMFIKIQNGCNPTMRALEGDEL